MSSDVAAAAVSGPAVLARFWWLIWQARRRKKLTARLERAATEAQATALAEDLERLR